MKQDLQELITLTELFIYENYSLAKTKASAPIIAPSSPSPIKEATIKEEPISSPKKEVMAPEQPARQAKIEKDFSDIERIFAKDLPHIKVYKEFPVEKETQWIAQIIVCKETEKELRFLQNVANSISYRFGPASLIKTSQFKPSASLKFLLLSKETLEIFPEIQKHNIPLCFFDNAQTYFKNPSSKALLWKAISKLCL